jgi:hypothetical protein
MVSVWWLLIAACVGVTIGMILFAVMTMAAEPSHAELDGAHQNEALT